MPSLVVIAMAATGLQLLALFLGVTHDVWSGGVPNRNTAVVTVEEANPDVPLLESNFSCTGRCAVSALSDPFNLDNSPGWCQCNPSCLQAGDCCTDYGTLCMTCKGKCGNKGDPSAVCNCNANCVRSKDCCPDYEDECHAEVNVPVLQSPPIQNARSGALPITLPKKSETPVSTTGGRISDTDLQNLSQRLFELDSTQLAAITLNLQGKTRSGNKNDLAPLPLFQTSPISQWQTVALIQKLYDNYHADVTKPEPTPADHAKEEEELLNAIVSTSIMQAVHDFLKSRDKAPASMQEFKKQLRSMWFTKFSRAHGVAGSSGFEHVFLGETKNGAPTGFHSWLFYRNQESGSKVNYLGYSRVLNLGKAKLIEMPLSWQGLYKPLNSLLAGTTPELEMALYTLCFVIRPNTRCSLSGGGNRFYVQTYVYNSKDGKPLVGTAYPYIP